MKIPRFVNKNVLLYAIMVLIFGVFVNEQLVRDGYAEAVLYQPDDLHYDEFVALEKSATSANKGCHPTGIFDDGSYTR